MNIRELHPWPQDCAAARQIQRQLRERIRIEPLANPPRRVAGGDVAYLREPQLGVAAVVIWDVAQRNIVEQVVITAPVRFPYVPGYLSFREIPLLLRAFSEVQTLPDAVIADGQGIAHPLRMGLAAHLGLWLDLPTVGCAKKRLLGEFEMPARRRGAYTWLYHGEERVGAVVRTRDGVKPVFVSPGHRMAVEEAVELVLRCGAGFRSPEPVRQAHLLATRVRASLSGARE